MLRCHSGVRQSVGGCVQQTCIVQPLKVEDSPVQGPSSTERHWWLARARHYCRTGGGPTKPVFTVLPLTNEQQTSAHVLPCASACSQWVLPLSPVHPPPSFGRVTVATPPPRCVSCSGTHSRWSCRTMVNSSPWRLLLSKATSIWWTRSTTCKSVCVSV